MGGRDHGKKALSWWGNTAPATQVSISSKQYVGMSFIFTIPGRIFGFRYRRLAGNSNVPWALLWDNTALHGVCSAMFFDETVPATFWQQVWIRPVRRVVVGDTYKLAVLATGQFFRTTNALGAGQVTNNGIGFQNGFQSTSIDPTSVALTLNTNANGVDVLFVAD